MRINMNVPVQWSILGIFMLTSVISTSGRSAFNVGKVVDKSHVIFRDTADNLPEQVDKRSVLGQIADKAIKSILNGAKFLNTNGLDSYFLKKGGPVKAVEDFYSLNPKNFRLAKIDGNIIKMQGDVGFWRVIFRHDESTERAIITVAKPKRRGQNDNLRKYYDKVGEKIIIYTD